MDYSFDPARVDRDQVFAWLRETYWSPNLRRDVFEIGFTNSVIIGAYDGDRIVGFARVISDKATFAWLSDVYVDASYRGRGIGREMVRQLMALPDFKTLRRWCLATLDAQGVYKALGYQDVDPGRFLIFRNPVEVWQDLSDPEAISPGNLPGPQSV